MWNQLFRTKLSVAARCGDAAASPAVQTFNRVASDKRLLAPFLIAFATVTALGQVSYELGSQTDLLDSAFYTGTPGGRAAFWGTLNNAGTKVAFVGVDYTDFTTAYFTVTPGDPSSWQQITTSLAILPQSNISWSPNDNWLFTEGFRINVTTGNIIDLSYGLLGVHLSTTVMPSGNWLIGHAPVIPPGSQFEVDYVRLQTPTYASEFNTDGDVEGWTADHHVGPLTASGGTLKFEVTGSDPYLSGPTFSAPFDATQSTTITIRMNSPFAGNGQLFWRTQANGWSSFSFDSGPASQFNDIVIDVGSHAAWTGQILELRIDPPTPKDNLWAVPITRSGALDTSRTNVLLTNFDDTQLVGGVNWTNVAPDASNLTFYDYKGNGGVGGADFGDVYVVTGLQDILSNATSPPTTLGDPRVIQIRTSESVNYATSPDLSQDGSLTIYCEDFNNQFHDDDFFGSLALANFDVMVSNADGSGSDYRIVASGNQAVPMSSQGGTRITYISTIADPLDFHLFMTTLEVHTAVSGDSVGPPANNDMLTTNAQEAHDGSGTAIEVPSGTTFDFPTGVSQEIVMSTPIDLVDTPQLPPSVNAIPVVREFGPQGTQFSPPIAITIAYTDAEIEGLDEATLEVYLYNPSTGIFDTPVAVTARDLPNNTISFETYHFSTFGVGDPGDVDEDGLSDADEMNVYGTNATDPDTDGDGLPDGWEVTNSLDPLDNGSANVDNGAFGDPDFDGYTNLTEFQRGGDPQTIDVELLPVTTTTSIFILITIVAGAGIWFNSRLFKVRKLQ